MNQSKNTSQSETFFSSRCYSGILFFQTSSPEMNQVKTEISPTKKTGKSCLSIYCKNGSVFKIHKKLFLDDDGKKLCWENVQMKKNE